MGCRGSQVQILSPRPIFKGPCWTRSCRHRLKRHRGRRQRVCNFGPPEVRNLRPPLPPPWLRLPCAKNPLLGRFAFGVPFITARLLGTHLRKGSTTLQL